MYNGNTVSLKTVLWKVMNHPLATELTYEQAAEYAIEAIRLLGCPLAYTDKVSRKLKVESYKAYMDFTPIEIKGIRAFSNKDDGEHLGVQLKRATDLYHQNLACNNANQDCPDSLGNDLSYTIQSNVVTTSFEKGYLEIAYSGLAVDDEDFPLIPDEQKTMLAVEYYVLHRFLQPLYDIGKVTDKAFNRIEQNYLWYISGASNALKISNYDHMEGIMNSITRLIVNDQAHSNFWKGANRKERLKRYN